MRQMQETENKNCRMNSRNIAMQIAIFLLYAFGFSVLLSSGLSADDMWNSNIQAAPYLDGAGPFAVMAGQWNMWLQAGRLFPFSNYAAIFFACVPSVPVYKGCILLMTYLSNLISGSCLKRLTDSKEIQVLYMILFPVLIQLTPEFDSGLYCYHMLIQMVTAWCFLALWMQLKYLRTNQKRYAAGAAGFFVLALGTYEVAFPFLLMLLWITYRESGEWKRACKRSLPLLIVFVCLLAANLWLRMSAGENSYHGVSVSLQGKAVFVTFLKQCATCLPLGRYLCSAIKYCEPYSDVYPYTIAEILGNLQRWDYLAVLLLVLIFIWREERCKKKPGLSDKDIRTILVLGGLVFLLPGCLIAVSAKYQNTIAWAGGHLPAYMQSMGFTMLLAGLYEWIKCRLSGWRRKVIVYGTLAAAVLVFVLNLASARAGVEYMNASHKYPQENLEAAAEAEFFDSVAEADGKLLFGIEDYIYNKQNSMEFYTKFAGKRINALTQTQVLEICREQDGDLYAPTGEEQAVVEYYGVWNDANRDTGIVGMGKCKEIEYREDDLELQGVILENPQIYLHGDPEWTIPQEWQLLREGEDYQIYQLYGNYRIEKGMKFLKKADDIEKS